MADRIGVINKGELIVVEEKAALMRKLGKKQLTLHLQEPMAAIPAALARVAPGARRTAGTSSSTRFDAQRGAHRRSRRCCARLGELGIGFKDLNTRQSSLEDIFVSLVSERA